MKKKGITLKIFYITSALLVVSALIIYLTLYFLLPNFYYSYKKSTLIEGVTSLVEVIEESPLEEVEYHLNEFVETYNVRLIIQNQFGYVIYFPMDRFIREDPSRGRVQFPGRSQLDRRILEDMWQNPNMITLSQPINLQEDPQQYVLTVAAPLQPIDEASKVILMFFPYMLIIIAIISVIGAYFYSNLISKPLLKLNNIAKKMAHLDFSSKSPITTNDELGELSKSLNTLSVNLQTNMDDLKQANNKLKNDIQIEREQEQKRREFIATISHELKTPLTAVSGQLEGMIYEIGSYKDRDKYLRQSYSILNEMEKLVLEILDVSQLESSYFTPNVQTINLSTLVQNAVIQTQYFLEQKQLKIRVSVEPNVSIIGDEKLIAKAIANIFSNAVKYTSTGECVDIQLFSRSNETVLKVLNSGAFIEEDQLNKVFEPFYRIEKSRNRKTGGSGLGLYIVKRILDMHKVIYSIENDPEGVLFTMIFTNNNEH
ncbi:HAMP domain-containing protein [Anaerobacillus alkaliphilus]|uniref:histidine kinase n=1 Tax=Anaerobacillus alkaliphilus TaxID=1548597 RepID=A0A4Q0VSQ4_9BACI|nr:HAMP domain-containing sensor histidine kinase [Anaerobacillus alkaliphilus]RXJ00700.1 HAMP domain-containing protein [Anaerobacillus alkaliphilus]